ncbi:MAG: helix-turn-helix domain-containing protein, partial [Longimicrobiales bacterium]
VPILVPPLRERRDDIPMLVRHFADKAADEQKLPSRRVATDAVERLTRMDWPGNVRELRNTVERLLILARGPEVGATDIDRLAGGARAGDGFSADLLAAATFSAFKDRAERAYILAKLRENEWNISETARTIDMPRSNLYKKIEKFNLVREDT